MAILGHAGLGSVHAEDVAEFHSELLEVGSLGRAASLPAGDEVVGWVGLGHGEWVIGYWVLDMGRIAQVGQGGEVVFGIFAR